MNDSVHLDSIARLGLMGWDVLVVGWDHGLVTRQDVTRFALDQLLSEAVSSDDTNTVMSLARAEPDRLDHLDIKVLMERLTRNSFDRETVSGEEKWRLVFLMALDAEPLDWEAKVTKLQELMADFGYPPEMNRCFRYGPSQFAIDSGMASQEVLHCDPLVEMRHVIADLKRRLCPECID